MIQAGRLIVQAPIPPRPHTRGKGGVGDRSANTAPHPNPSPPSTGARGFYATLLPGGGSGRGCGRLLRNLLWYRLLEAVAEVHQLGLGGRALGRPARRLTRMFGFAVDAFQERHQLLAECLIIVGTAQASGVAKLHELESAHRTLVLVDERVVLCDRSLARRSSRTSWPDLGQKDTCSHIVRRDGYFLELTFAEHFGDVQGGRLADIFDIYAWPGTTWQAIFKVAPAILTGGRDLSRKRRTSTA